MTIEIREAGIAQNGIKAIDTNDTPLPVGEWEVELVWQYENEIDEWYSVPSVRYDEFETFEYYKKDSDYWNIETRQVYIASVAPEKEVPAIAPVHTCWHVPVTSPCDGCYYEREKPI